MEDSYEDESSKPAAEFREVLVSPRQELQPRPQIYIMWDDGEEQEVLGSQLIGVYALPEMALFPSSELELENAAGHLDVLNGTYTIQGLCMGKPMLRQKHSHSAIRQNPEAHVWEYWNQGIRLATHEARRSLPSEDQNDNSFTLRWNDLPRGAIETEGPGQPEDLGHAESVLKQYEDALQAVREEWKKKVTDAYEIMRQCSEEAGVQMDYVLKVFPGFVANELNFGEKKTKQTSFKVIAEKLWKESSFFAEEKDLCPRDGKRGRSFMDSLPLQHRGKATHFVSWCWNYTVGDVVGAFESWCKAKQGRDPKAAFLWMCFFCNNQHRDNTMTAELMTKVETKLKSINKMIIIMDKYEEPQYIKRAWCIFESFVATKIKDNKNDFEAEAVLPESAFQELKKMQGKDIKKIVKKCVKKIDAETAESSNPEDAEAIKDIIRDPDDGYDDVNDSVKDALVSQLTQAAKSFVEAN